MLCMPSFSSGIFLFCGMNIISISVVLVGCIPDSVLRRLRAVGRSTYFRLVSHSHMDCWIYFFDLDLSSGSNHHILLQIR